MNEQHNALPLLALRGLTVFPNMVLSFEAGREYSIAAVEAAVEGDQTLFLCMQKDPREEDPSPEQLHEIGAIAKIRQVVKVPGEDVRITVEGICRARRTETLHGRKYWSAVPRELPDLHDDQDAVRVQAAIRVTQGLFEEYSELVQHVPSEIMMNIMAAQDAGYLADYIANHAPFPPEQKQRVLEERHVLRRLELVSSILEQENEILAMENEIHEQVRDAIDQNQKEFYIREQIRQLSARLGEGDNPQEEAARYHEEADKLHLPEESAEKLHKEIDKLLKMPAGSHDAAVLKNYLDTVIGLPWNTFTKDTYDVAKAAKVLERDHYGLEKVKERILEFISVKKLAPELKGQILCLVGPPGVGKTSIARSIAKAIHRNFARLSLGGIRDEAEIRGHRKTYIAAMPGRIINAVATAKSRNPVILLDEIDKLGNDYRGDPASALLEVLDAEQNVEFRDHYIELPFDLSDVLFITTANTLDTIPRPLLDRMEVIELTSYTAEEKFHIAKEHLVKKQMKKHGLNSKMLHLSDGLLHRLIAEYTREAGVRQLEREIAALCRKAAKQLVSTGEKSIRFTEKSLEELLGPAKFSKDPLAKKDEIGVVNGLAWTSVGGEMLQIEVNVMEGSGKLELTGSLGDVMKESAKAAVSYLRARGAALGIDPQFYKTKDIHIHVPDGATPKDGPSAGITIATALVSALTNRPVRHEVAMTGEITIRGRVLPIGGLKEKTMAALKSGMRTVVIPQENLSSLAEVDRAVREKLQFVPASEFDQVLSVALVREEPTRSTEIAKGKKTAAAQTARRSRAPQQPHPAAERDA